MVLGVVTSTSSCAPGEEKGDDSETVSWDVGWFRERDGPEGSRGKEGERVAAQFLFLFLLPFSFSETFSEKRD